MNNTIFWMNGADCPIEPGFVTLYSDDCDFLPVKEKNLREKIEDYPSSFSKITVYLPNMNIVLK